MPKLLVISLFALAVILGTACAQPEPAPAATTIRAPTATPIPSTLTATPTPATEPTTTAAPTATPTLPQSSEMITPTLTPTGRAIAIEEPTPTITTTPVPTPERVELVSDIVDFILQDLTIEVGTGVLWTNRDISSHTSTSGKLGGITGILDSRSLSTGRSFSFTFNQTGTFPYFCEIHPFMQATVTVVESLPGGPTASTPTLTPTHEPMAMEEPTPTPTHEAMAM